MRLLWLRLFRRWPNIAGVFGNLVFCTLISILLTLLAASPGSFATYWMVSQSIGFSIYGATWLAFVVGSPRFPPIPLAMAGMICGLLPGLVLSGSIALGDPWYFFTRDTSGAIFGLLFGGIAVGVGALASVLWDT